MLHKRWQSILLTNNSRLVNPEPQPRAQQLAGGGKVQLALGSGVVKYRRAALAVQAGEIKVPLALSAVAIMATR
ncbi:MAG: hypothetical protein COW02_18170 [Comamonadaceae bacterium CG12_big_fil_rev_8_21_14_0_65_59_15]|nr:MAG: hypothetical protein COW02_18170 [Comamonadaceae bacterium CG12_big_fil_rev_8_21_14_0_65_59_15]